MFRRAAFLLYRETPLHELKGLALATMKAKATNAPLPSTVIVDVREPSELVQDGEIPAAVHIPLGKLAEALSERDNAAFVAEYAGAWEALDPAKHTIVFSCRSGRRSMTAIDIAEASGFRASHYIGGNNGYQQDPLTDADIQAYLSESARNSSQ